MIKHRHGDRVLEVCDENSGVWQQCCADFGIRKLMVDAVTGDQIAELYVDSPKTGLAIKMVSPHALLTRNVLHVLYDMGLRITDKEEESLAINEILMEEAASAPVAFVHNRVGFVMVDGVECFLLNRPIGLTGPKSSSLHNAPNVFAPCGTLEEWKTVIREQVQGNPPLELAVCIGALAPIAHILRSQGVVIDVPIIALVGRSSSGKTTALRLAASLWGKPTEEGLIDDLHATENALVAGLAENMGVPNFLDEASAGIRAGSSLEELLYFLPKGRGKKRCCADGTVKPRASFSGTVVFSSEDSLLRRAAKNLGLHARIVELTLDKWTNSAEHAEIVTFKVLSNYAVAGPVLVEWILENEEEILRFFQEERAELGAIVGEIGGVEERILRSMAMLMTAARALEASLGITLDLPAQRELLVQQLMSARPERDVTSKAYDAIMNFYVNNASRFVSDGGTGKMTSRCDALGSVSFYQGKRCMWLPEERLDIVLRSANIHTRRDVLSELAERGLLAKFSARHYFRGHKINGAAVNCCCLFMPEQAGLFERLDGLPECISSRDIAHALTDDSFESAVSNQASIDETLKSADETDTTMLLAILHPCPQGLALVFNRHLAKAIGVKTEAFLTVISDEQTLLLSRVPSANTSVKIKLRTFGDLFVFDQQTVVATMMKNFAITIAQGDGLIFRDVQVGHVKGGAVAAVKLDTASSLSCSHVSVSTWDLPSVDNKDNKKSQI